LERAPDLSFAHLFMPVTDPIRAPLILLDGSGNEAGELVLLPDFIEAASARYSFTRTPIAIGFSNGVVIAAAPLLTRPSVLAGTIIIRPLSPFTRDPPTRLNGKPALIIEDEKDTRRSSGDSARLAERLICAGATVRRSLGPMGHSITTLDREVGSALVGAYAMIEMRCLVVLVRRTLPRSSG
jgi:phospholipase/carboxylesterase